MIAPQHSLHAMEAQAEGGNRNLGVSVGRSAITRIAMRAMPKAKRSRIRE
jgi:hypothetical protein